MDADQVASAQSGSEKQNEAKALRNSSTGKKMKYPPGFKMNNRVKNLERDIKNGKAKPEMFAELNHLKSAIQKKREEKGHRVLMNIMKKAKVFIVRKLVKKLRTAKLKLENDRKTEGTAQNIIDLHESQVNKFVADLEAVKLINPDLLATETLDGTTPENLDDRQKRLRQRILETPDVTKFLERRKEKTAAKDKKPSSADTKTAAGAEKKEKEEKREKKEKKDKKEKVTKEEKEENKASEEVEMEEEGGEAESVEKSDEHEESEVKDNSKHHKMANRREAKRKKMMRDRTPKTMKGKIIKKNEKKKKEKQQKKKANQEESRSRKTKKAFLKGNAQKNNPPKKKKKKAAWTKPVELNPAGKNRPGQRTRQKIAKLVAEKKPPNRYELKRLRDQEFEEKKQKFQKKKPPVAEDKPFTALPKKFEKSSGDKRKVSAASTPVVDPTAHPSWIAKKQKQEAEQKASFQGKRVLFD